MARLELTGVHVDLPVFTSRSRGLLNSVFRFAQRERARVESVGMFSYEVHALRGIDLRIREGDKVGLVGRNGAGKTTLLRVLSGAYEPTRGEIAIEGPVSSLTDLWLGMVKLGPWQFHPLVLMFAISGSLMVSKTVRIPKP